MVTARPGAVTTHDVEGRVGTAAGQTVYVGSRDAERGRWAAGLLGRADGLIDVTDDG